MFSMVNSSHILTHAASFLSDRGSRKPAVLGAGGVKDYAKTYAARIGYFGNTMTTEPHPVWRPITG